MQKGVTEGEMVGWHHRLNGHGFEQAPEDGEGQGSLVCCSPWGLKESDTPERLNNSGLKVFVASVEAWSPGLQTKEISGAQRCLLEASKRRAVSGWLSVGVPLFSSVWG